MNDDGGIFYDGAMRNAADAANLAAADAASFCDRTARAYARSGNAWRELLDACVIPPDLPSDVVEQLEANGVAVRPSTKWRASEVCSFELIEDTLVITPHHHHRHCLDAIHRWLVDAHANANIVSETPSHHTSPGRLHLALVSVSLREERRASIASTLEREADEAHDELRRGVDALRKIVQRPELGRLEMASAAAAVDVAKASKRRVLERSPRVR